MRKQFSTYISQPSLDFCPGGEPASFWIAVQNNSPDYASFQLSLKAAGVEEQLLPRWYKLVSADAYTIPPNDCIKFEVNITDLPPSREGFVGILALQANTYSPELDAHDSQTIKLCVTGVSPEIVIHTDNLQVVPETQLAIAVDVVNPNQHPTSLALQLTGLPADWLPDEKKSLLLSPKATQRVTFLCRVPVASQVPCGFYPFSVDILQAEKVTVSQSALLEVLQAGQVVLQCDAPHQRIPARAGRFLNSSRQPATYTFTAENQSNVEVAGDVLFREKSSSSWWKRWRSRWAKETDREPISMEVDLPLGSEKETHLRLDCPRPWLGWGRYREFEPEAYQLAPTVDIQSSPDTLSVQVLPVIARWLQGLGIIGLMILGWLLVFQGHRATVTYVQFPHKTEEPIEEVISGAIDGEVLSWPVALHRTWRPQKVEGQEGAIAEHPVEVIRYQPPDNTLVAVGFKDGKIRLYNQQNKQFEYALDANIDKPCEGLENFKENDTFYTGDRIFDLLFSSDGQTLYSAHGSGRILKWPLTEASKQPTCLQPAEHTIAAMTWIETAGQPLLAVAGSGNRLKLIDGETGAINQILPPIAGASIAVSRHHHIRTLASPTHDSSYLAVGDDRGNLSLVDLNACSAESCDRAVAWSGHDGKPIRATAFSDDGCYLTSVGDDGQAKLWPIDTDMADNTPYLRRFPAEEIVIRKSRQRFSRHPLKLKALETVDLVQVDNKLLVLTGGKDQQVHIDSKSISSINRRFKGHTCPTKTQPAR
ncbi:MAG: WD40 repeat domain-containing protein [Cyanobacteria bacterium J06560_6]